MRQRIFENRKRAADSLLLTSGGNLGVVSVKEIVIGCNNVSACRNDLLKIPGIQREENDLFTFNTGPTMRLINAGSGGIQKIILKINSLEVAKRYLQEKKLLGSATKGKISIAPQAIDGLLVELVDK
jgi:hypothetical protein